MKASTLFVVAIALLIGLGAAAGARYFGLFKAKDDTPVAKEESVLVLVANKDLHKSIAITSADVRVRELAPSERQLYEQIRARVMPPMVSAAQLKIPLRKIPADEILKRTDFQEELPEAVSLRIPEGMRAVNVSVTKDRCAGGVIQQGEYVDVLLTSRISNDPKIPNAETKTALLARDCRVIMKRNRMVNVLAADPDGPISFTLEVNPYRAALIEYAQHKGIITLLPVNNPNATILSPTASRPLPRSMSDMSSIEFANEEKWSTDVRNGDRVVSDVDLKRIFSIKDPVPPIPPIVVNTVIGIAPARQNVFPVGGGRYQAPQGSSQTGGSNASIQNPNDPAECKDCPKKEGPASGISAPITPKK